MTTKAVVPDLSSAIESFSYRSVASLVPRVWNGLMMEEIRSGAEETSDALSTTPELAESASSPLSEQFIAEEYSHSFAAARAKGYEEGRAAERQAAEATEANQAVETGRREAATQAARRIESFSRAQERYLQALEPEVVRLALGIAARILRHEAQMDPLLLTGAVRVALGQIPASARIRLLVPPADLDLWTEAIALLPNLPVKPVVAPREGMQLGDCALESDLGSADLSIAAQLLEIEQAFRERGGEEHDLSVFGISAPAAEPHPGAER